MVEDQKIPEIPGGEEDSFELDLAGEAAGHISFDQARALALRTARSEPGEYGRFTGSIMAFHVEYEYETEDHYVITLLYRPRSGFAGSPGREQFFIDKEGMIARRRVGGLPEPERLWRPPGNMQKSIASDKDPISVPWSVMDMVIGTVAVVGSLLGFLVLLRLVSLFVRDGLDGLELIWLASASEGVLVYVVWRLAVKKYGIGWDALGLRRPRTRRNAALVAVTLIGSLVLTGVYAVLVKQLDIDILIPQPVPEELQRGGAFYRLLTALAIAGLVPFVEEIFFRGFLFQGLASRYGVIWGAVFSAAVFAVAHLSIGTMIPIFMIGVLFAALYARTRSLWMPMSAHVIQNLVALTVSSG
ncbi:MAG: CPBP family intramembrane metalloprotease [Chloroflexi bacterium]|nr:CPBP family intramembrane metalloprotease [Chloroflexota bacterium]